MRGLCHRSSKSCLCEYNHHFTKGYAETGFEIFDEEGDEENADTKKGKKDKGGKDGKKNAASSAAADGKSKNPDIKDPNKPDKKPASLKVCVREIVRTGQLTPAF